MRSGATWARRLGSSSLTRQVALLSLLPVVALGFVLARVLQDQVVSRTLADASTSAQVIARVGIQPLLTPRELRDGLSARQVALLDRQLRGSAQVLARIKIWSATHRVVYSDDHALIGRALDPSDDLLRALAGRPEAAQVVQPSPRDETASEVGLGRLVEVYVPLRFSARAAPAGVFEIYLGYGPIAAAIARDKRTILLLIAGGLTLLWALLYRIVVGASRKLRRQARENHRLARYDQLTGLPNRMLFSDRLARAARRGEEGRPAVLMIDIDRFNEINNTLGSANGDELLREVARRLRAGLGEDALAARLGGDQYAVLCPRAQGGEGALATAQAIRRALEEPVVVEGIALEVEASIGIAAMGDAEDAQLLLRRADVALAHAKARGSGIELYSPERDRFDAEGLKLLGQVRGALEREELVLHYQPQLDLRSGRIVGVEALVRWRHPQLGLLAPARFIGLIEQTALVGPLALYTIERALGQLVAWEARGRELRMSVNLSARNLLDEELPGGIARLLDEQGLCGERLTIEVTESAAMADHERAARALQALRDAGIGVSIDDFGTGNASIEYLAALPASELKIDKSLITGIVADRRAEAIVRSTIDLARHLELSVVAEGIEEAGELERLTALGCDVGQGYLIGRPAPPDELTWGSRARTASALAQ